MTTGDFAGAKGVCCSCRSAGVGRVPWPSVCGGGGSGALSLLDCHRILFAVPPSEAPTHQVLHVPGAHSSNSLVLYLPCMFSTPSLSHAIHRPIY